MYTTPEGVEAVITLLVEGCSIRSIQRITGIDQNTVMNILVLAGERCERLLVSKVSHLPVLDAQCDEMWGFVGCKVKRNYTDHPERGDAYCLGRHRAQYKVGGDVASRQAISARYDGFH